MNPVLNLALNRVYLGIGSNWQAAAHITLALDALAERYGRLELSPVYESEPVGFAGRNFLNLVAGLDTAEAVGDLSRWLKQTENRYGRRRDGSAYGRGALDVDILTYGDVVGTVGGVQLPRGEIVQNAFVLQPLAELAPADVHPTQGRTYSELWAGYSRQQKLWKVPFHWRGLELPAIYTPG